MPPSPPTRSRRAFLARAGGAALTATALGGCLSGRLVGGETPESTQTGTDAEPIASPARADASRWPMGDHDTGATRHNPEVDAGTAPTSAAWTYSLPQSHLPTDPALGPERLYVGIGNHEPTPAKTRVAAFALDDGAKQWERPLAYTRDATPTLASDGDGVRTLFALSGQDNSNTGPGQGEVLALDPATGERRWRWTVGRALSGPVVVSDGRLFVHNTSHGKTAVHALDATTGTEVWRFEAGLVLHHAPTVADGRVFANSGRHRLAALNATDGTVEWETETKADDMRPVVDAKRGHVLMGHPKGLEAVSATTGERIWSLTTTSSETKEKNYLGVIRGPVVTDDVLYVQTSDTSPFAIGDPGHLHGVDPATGEIQWSLETGRPASHALGAGGRAIVARRFPERTGTSNDSEQSATGDVAAVAADGSVAWTMDGQWNPVAVGAGRMVAYRGSTESLSSQVDIRCFAFD
ncbi:PQQ-like beta-propeller repeat protein (plasmid) [Halorussus limi]|uniref:PQQ-like beta-propeller repeat protein n=1 Tax=Halorussus limi TaxID=2938695 RepID=A0A8U0I1T9_9EURY|nr:PQQ-binding-like beta-propeller repeat protein [Halorussus limi]UPV76886.1 PQQ-like beta-propeller repeat protein [Halorussus limi]